MAIGRDYFFGYFDNEDDAGTRAGHVSRALGEQNQVNFDANGKPTGYDGSRVGYANLVQYSASTAIRKYIGVSEDNLTRKGRGSPQKMVRPNQCAEVHPKQESLCDCCYAVQLRTRNDTG
jgi:hypothetical protein